MRVVQMSEHQVIHMVPMRDGVVTTACAVDVVIVVGTAGVVGCARVGVGGIDRERVVVVVVTVDVMEMSVVEIVHVSVVLDALVATAHTMDVSSMVVATAVMSMTMVVPMCVVVVMATAGSVYVSAHRDLPPAKGMLGWEHTGTWSRDVNTRCRNAPWNCHPLGRPRGIYAREKFESGVVPVC
jgi:hypothetical protein